MGAVIYFTGIIFSLIIMNLIATLLKRYLFKSVPLKQNNPQYKLFKEIPTLKSYPLIGHSYLFFPGAKYKSERLTEAFVDISRTLGPIFRLQLGATDMVVTLNPDDSRTLFQNEGRTPKRPAFAALVHYRTKAFNSVGVVPGNGEEWYKMRKGVTPLLQHQVINPYKKQQQEIAKIFTDYVKLHRGENFVLQDIYSHLLKFTIEAISVVSPGHHFHCLFNDNEETQTIIDASINFMDGLHRTLMEPPLWKIWKTAGYKKLETSHNTIYKILRSHLEDIEKQYHKDPEKLKEMHPYMYSLFSNDQISLEDKIMLAIEIFLGGIDATATTIAFTCYYLSRDRDVQEIARSSLSEGTDFLKACIKETLRLSPTAGGNSRYLINDTIMSGYFVPKETLVLSLHSGLSKDNNIFNEAEKYYPQRFMKDTRENFHRFASLPFGHGPRMCPGKRVAENEMVILLAEILKNFVLEPAGSDNVGMVFRMNRIPDRPINIKFVNTNH
ncbi:hypothetical protein Zmor_007219 [Zophobas morio]|uniref:Cytochrome P450 n=1 Tax=Zophobas morio TaxID=2755281 RepID=A0AA38MP52_9CUCU|nr:hypothetical protein Zmor_007219 [Zophobas morio]